MPKFNMELVLNIWLNKFGIKIYVEHNLNFSDNIDYLERRSRRLLLSIWLRTDILFWK
jgi:hypothetical protein